MGRHDRKHGRHHKAAALHAHEGLGLTADQVSALAEKGLLKTPEGRLPHAFTIAPSTVRNICQLARRRERRAATNGGYDGASAQRRGDRASGEAEAQVRAAGT